ncbi:UNVERIFIED_CONTAM: hypothetical protein GTU68_001244 [Idotea baltica]|nr:hypothetical protein [Idotea baltica]
MEAIMLADEELLRYSRQILLSSVDIQGQLKLKNSRVLILGLGGLGSPVSLYLAAAGVGELHLADFDTVDLTNLQRQIVHDSSSIGKTKVSSAIQRLKSLNDQIRLVPYEVKLTESRLCSIMQNIDVVVDCTDNFLTRDAINRQCFIAKKPLISGAAIGMDGQLTVFDSRKPNSPCYQCVYGSNDGSVSSGCNDSGVLGPVVGLVGSLQALEVMKVLIGFGQPLVGRLLLIDARRLSFKELMVKRDLECSVCGGVCCE